jgi:hypothetical protein
VSCTKALGAPGPTQEERWAAERTVTGGHKRGRTEEGGGGLPVTEFGTAKRQRTRGRALSRGARLEPVGARCGWMP